MKYIKSALVLIYTILFPLTALAAETAPEAPLERIRWAMEKCGPMPKAMVTGFILLAAMIVITILVAKMKGVESNE